MHACEKGPKRDKTDVSRAARSSVTWKETTAGLYERLFTRHPVVASHRFGYQGIMDFGSPAGRKDREGSQRRYLTRLFQNFLLQP